MIDERIGAQMGMVAKAFENRVPPSSSHFRVFGMMNMESARWSSVRMTRTFGRCPDGAVVEPAAGVLVTFEAVVVVVTERPSMPPTDPDEAVIGTPAEPTSGLLGWM